jgi:cell wall-associated NlpC family hydrolase
VLPAPKPAPAPPKVATPTPAPNGSKASAIASAALAQLGRIQDCTMLVTNALAAVGVSFHDWPAGYLSLGTTVSAAAAVPGDLLYYANGGTGVAHIAVYIGNGMAVHGGWNGNQTVTFSANVGSGPVFIRVA